MNHCNPNRLFSTLLVFLACYYLVEGQNLHFQPAPSQNRISENASRCFYKDSKGFIWVGTIDGLNRYDGYRFRIYQNDPRDTSSISGNYVTCIQEDRNGRLWIGTNNGLNLYQAALDGFKLHEPPKSDLQNITGDHVTSIILDDRQQLWVASYGGLGHFDENQQQFIAVPFDSTGNPDAILHYDVTALSDPGKQGFWVGYQDGRLSRYDKNKFIHYHQVEIGGSISDLQEDQHGQLWIGADNGIYRFDPSTQSLTQYREDRTWDIYRIDDEVWFNVNFKGINRWNAKEQQLEPIPVFVDGRQVYGDVKAFFKDERGIIWGSYHGLFKQDPYEKRFRWVRHEKGNPNSISETFVSGVAEDDQGNWVVLTINQGLNYYNRRKGVWHNYFSHPWFDNELVGKRMSRLKVYGHTAWMLGPEAVFEFNLHTGRLREFVVPQWQEGRLNGTVARDGPNNYWVSTSRLQLLDTQTGMFHDHTPPHIGGEESMQYVLHQQRNGQIWALGGNRIFEIEGHRVIERYQVSQTEPGFGEAIISFNRDQAGRFWIGRRNGLEYFDPQDGSLKHYSIADGLPSNSINSILIDDHGKLWLATNNGLSCFDPITETFRNYDRQDGVQDEIFLPNAAFRSKDGVLYFGGVNGFNVFHPDSIATNNPHPPKLLIHDFKIFNKSVKPGPDAVLDQPISETQRLELSYKHSTISFELLALGYSQPEKNQYAYMIEGVDPDWNYVGTGHTASYTGLPRGEELVFKAKAANHDGVWSESPTTLDIYIRPPFWETGWFRAAFLLLLAGLVSFYYRWRVKSIKARNLWLEREVSKQTAEIEQQASNLRIANKELKEQSAIIKQQVLQLDQLYRAQSRFFTSLSHEFRTPLTLLLGNLEQLSNSKHPEKIIEKITARMQMSTQQLLHLVNQLMDTAKLESGQYQLGVTEGDIVGEVQNLFSSFQVLADKKGLELIMYSDPGIASKCWFDRDILFKVLNNLVSNAIKFTNNGKVKLEVQAGMNSSGQEAVFFRLSDTGIGISGDQLLHIFDRFYQAEGPLSARKKGTGIGLALVKQLIELHKGHIEVQSEKGRGTTFKFWLPVSKVDYSSSERSDQRIESDISYGEWRKDTHADVSSAKANGVSQGKEGPLLLVAEDNPEIRAFIVRQLVHSYRIVEAEHGAQAWKLAIKEIPDLIISDVIMPEVNGFEFCDKVKSDERTSHIPFILLTALAEQEKKVEGLKKGADAYLSKPFSREELLLRVGNLIEYREKLRQKFVKEYGLGQLPPGLDELEQAFVKKILALIEQNIADEQFGIEQMVKALGISRTQLFRKLKSLTGMSATEFVRDYRLRKAYHLLHEENQTVSEVIHATGFNSRSYFYDSFKKKFGMVPSKVKKA